MLYLNLIYLYVYREKELKHTICYKYFWAIYMMPFNNNITNSIRIIYHTIQYTVYTIHKQIFETGETTELPSNVSSTPWKHWFFSCICACVCITYMVKVAVFIVASNFLFSFLFTSTSNLTEKKEKKKIEMKWTEKKQNKSQYL